MNRRLRALGVVALVATIVLGAAGCTSDKSKKTSNDGKTLEKVTYLTAFGAVGRDAMAWVAKDKGYFAEQGLDVTIQLGAAVDANLKALAANQAQYATLDLTGALIQAGKGSFKDFRAIAAIHQQTLVSIISLEGSGITSPKDLNGKTLGAANGSVNQLLFPAYAKLANVDEKSVKWVNTTPQGINQLLVSGQVNALSTFLISKGGIEKVANKKTVVLPYSDFLSDLFGNAVVTSAATAQKSPDQAKRFRTALLKGLQYTIDHPEEAAQILHKAQESADVGAATSEIKLMTPYVKSTGGGIGSLDESKVSRSIAILQGAGLIPSGLTPSAVVDFNLTPKV